MLLAPGDSVSGKSSQYRIIREIGCGGLGCAYLATTPSGQEIVVKLPNPASSDGAEEARDRMEYEIKSLRELWDRGGHDCIVRYIDDGLFGVHPFVVEEYILGQRLDKIIKTEKYDQESALKICIKLQEAVDFMNSAHFFYRDWFGDNTVIRASGEPVIIDFGTMKYGKPKDNVTRVLKCGNAPEVKDGNLHETSDSYSVASTLFAMMIGTTDLDGYTDRDLRFIKKPSDIVKCDEWLGEVLNCLLRPDPSDRGFENSAQVLEALRERRFPPSLQAKLIAGGKVCSLGTTKEHSIGREETCDVFVDDSECYMSESHAKIYYESSKGSWIIEDAASLNGTVVKRGTDPLSVVFSGEAHRSFGPRSFVLQDRDVIGLCYDGDRGRIHRTITFRSK